MTSVNDFPMRDMILIGGFAIFVIGLVLILLPSVSTQHISRNYQKAEGLWNQRREKIRNTVIAPLSEKSYLKTA